MLKPTPNNRKPTTILVTGANGQLGKTIEALNAINKSSLDFTFVSKNELDITCNEALSLFFKTNNFDYCINCAAYTNVEQAEKTPDIAYKVNAEGVKNLAEACKETHVVLIHISTDYVFDGEKKETYKENDLPNPLNEYGKSKLLGEQHIQSILNKYFIIRTSWLYSKYGHNFLKTMLRLASEKDELSIIKDQVGTPTYASDLAKLILDIIQKKVKNYGVYNYANKGETSWYNYAKVIFEIIDKRVILNAISYKAYPSLVTRPIYSVLNTEKIESVFRVSCPNWEVSLKEAIKTMS